MGVPAATPAARRRWLWRHRGFMLLWGGETVSGLGDAMAGVAVPLVAVSVLHASALVVSALTAATFLPYLVLGLPAGAWVDRLPKRPVMVSADVAQLVLFASLPAASALGVLSVGQLLAVSLLAGTAAMVFNAAWGVYLTEVVDPEDLLEGNAKLQGSGSVTRVVGPGLGGLAAAALGPVTTLALDAGSFLLSAGALLGVPRRPPAPPEPAGSVGPAGPEGPTTIRQDIREGLAVVVADRYLRPLVIWAALANVGLAGYFALVVVFLVRVVHLPPAGVGALLSVGGLGGVLGALTARRLADRFGTARTLSGVVTVTMPAGMLITLSGPGAALAVAVVGILALEGGLVLGSILLATFEQRYVPQRLLARVKTTQRMVTYGVAPPAALLAGLLADTVGARLALASTLGVGAAATALLWTGPFRGLRDLPTRPAGTEAGQGPAEARGEQRPTQRAGIDDLTALGGDPCRRDRGGCAIRKSLEALVPGVQDARRMSFSVRGYRPGRGRGGGDS
jgi:predicted MFS family arabinose efflux permease